MYLSPFFLSPFLSLSKSEWHSHLSPFISRPSPIHLYRRGLGLDHAVAAVVAQLDRVRRAGLRLQYLNDHIGVGGLPGSADRLKAVAETYGLIVARDVTIDLPRLPDDGPSDRAAS